MALSAAQLLDELMGRDRNRAPGEPSSKHHWSDPEVCKYFLCGFCPHELFTNTKADLGTCPKVHDEPLKKEYEKSSRKGTMGYEENFMRFLQGTMADVERRIRRGHERLALNAQREKELSNVKGDDERISMISDHINQLLGEIESLGSEGKVEQAQGVMRLVDQLKEEKETLTQMSKLNPLSSQEKQMEVCQICGAFLIVGDAQSRVDDHLQGKQHVGYARIKSTLEEMQTGAWRAPREDKKEEPDVVKKPEDSADGEKNDREGSRESSRRRERSGERRRERNQSRERTRDRDRIRDRDRRDRERSRDRRRNRDRRRSRSRERRSRSRDRYRRRGSRDRRRSSSRGRRRRSSSRERRRRSPSRERSRRRSRDRERRKRSRSSSRDRRRSRSSERRRRRTRSRSMERKRRRSRSQSNERKQSRASSDSEPSGSRKDKEVSKDRDSVGKEAVASTRNENEATENHNSHPDEAEM